MAYIRNNNYRVNFPEAITFTGQIKKLYHFTVKEFCFIWVVNATTLAF